MRFAVQKQAVEQHCRDADADRAVGNVECRPVPRSYMEIEKINDGAMANPVDDITDRATDDQADCDREERARDPAQPINESGDNRGGGEREEQRR